MLNTHDNLTPKEYLNRVYYLDMFVNTKLEQASRLRALATKVSSHISDMPRTATSELHSMESTIVKLVDLEREIDADIDSLVDTRREIAELIKAIPQPEWRLVLEMRYLSFCKWADIAETLGLDERSVHKRHGKALAYIEKIWWVGTKGQ